mgnify:CR=1 FL=1
MLKILFLNSVYASLNLVKNKIKSYTITEDFTPKRDSWRATNGYISYCNGGSCYDNSDYHVYESTGEMILLGNREHIYIQLDATYTIKTFYIAWADSFMATDDSGSHHLSIYVDDELCEEFPDF